MHKITTITRDLKKKRETDISITNWMKLHGIVDDDRNFNTIAKILQRSRAAYCSDGRLTNHKSSKHRKK